MSHVTTSAECASDLRIDEALSGELPMSEFAALEQHRLGCASCRARWDGIASERAAFLARAPSLSHLAQRVAAERSRPPRRERNTAVLVGAVAAGLAGAAAVLLVLPRATPPSTPPSPAPDATAAAASQGVRSKGGPHIAFFVKRGMRVERGQDGTVLRPGERLRFTYSSEEPRYFALLNRDGRRTSVYYPEGAQAQRMPSGQNQPLPFSVELDDYIGVEHVFAVFCRSPFALEPLTRSGPDGAAPSPAPDCSVQTIRLVKEAPPPEGHMPGDGR